MDGLEYRRLLPRYQVWLRNHPPKKVTLYEKLTHLFSKKTKIEIPTIPVYNVPKDILRLIVQYLPLEGQSKWRLVSHYWHDYVDIKTPYWKKVERHFIERDFPSFVKNIFDGTEAILNIPQFEFSTYELMERFSNYRPFRFTYHINFLKPDFLKHAISRGVAPDGYYFIAMVVRNVTLNNAMIITIHENQTAWTVSVSPWNFDYYAPFSGDISLKDNNKFVPDPGLEEMMHKLIRTGRVRHAIGNIVQVQCDFLISAPKDVPHWNW